jgi:hypothetical protein
MQHPIEEIEKTIIGALELYKSLGFLKSDESVHMIHGGKIEFIDMLITKEQFNNF